MSADTPRLSAEHHKLGKPGGPGLFHDKSLQLPAYIQNIARALMRKRGMPESKAIQVAIGVCRNWASGRGGVHPEVKAAAAKALAEWEKDKMTARATPNRSDHANETGSGTVDLAVSPVFGESTVSSSDGPRATVNTARRGLSEASRHKAAEKGYALPDGSFPIRNVAELHRAIQAFGRAKNKALAKRHIIKRARTLKALKALPEAWHVPDGDGDADDVTLSVPADAVVFYDGAVDLANSSSSSSSTKKSQRKPYTGKLPLPPGAVGFKHGWVPVDANGNPVGPSQMNKDMRGHDKATQAAIKQAYANKAATDAKRAANRAKAKAQSTANAKDRAAKATARKRAAAVKAAAKRALAQRKSEAAKAARAKQTAAAAKTRAHQRLLAEAIRQAEVDQKAGRALTPAQERLLSAAHKANNARVAMLRNISG